MSLIHLAGKLAEERGFNDEMLNTLTAMIDKDIAALADREVALEQQLHMIESHRHDLERRKAELATEFATRRAALSALIGEEGGNG